MTPNANDVAADAPDYTFARAAEPALTSFLRMDAYQDAMRPYLRSDEGEGYWVFTDSGTIVDGLQKPDLWSSAVVLPTQPNPPYRWVPIMLDPPEHTKWRQLLSSYFSPRRIKSMLQEQHDLARTLVRGIAQQGRCEFVREVGHVYPSTIFLRIMGMPVDMLDEFMMWEETMLRTLDADDPDMSRRMSTMQAVSTYFGDLISERRRHPITGADDIVSAAVSWEIDGAPVDDGDIVNCFLLLFLAGLDTVAGQFSYALLYLATHPAEQAKIATSPAIIPAVVEELLRAFPIVQTARVATREFDFHGCPVKAGDVASFPLSAVGRDNLAVPNAREVELDRTGFRSYAFGAGPHRCLGSHLARQEMVVLLAEWHAQIPTYSLGNEPKEHSGGVWGLDELVLVWR
jgi:cytochrome P450